MVARLALCFLVFLLVGCSKPPPATTITDYGIYSAVVVVKGNWKLGLPVGITSVEDLQHQESATRILCRAGVYWGMRVKVANPHSDRSISITCTIHHPPFTSPDGKTSSEETHSYPDLAPGETMDVNALWFFLESCSFEFVPGPWTIRIDVDGQPVATKIFDIDRP